MKRLLFLLALAIPVVAMAQRVVGDSIAQMAREQIVAKVRLPAVASVLDSSWISRAALDRMMMKFYIKPNGKVDVRSLDFRNSSVEPINSLFRASLRRVKIPRELVPEGATVVVGVKLKFEFLNSYATRYITRYTVEREGGPRNLPKEHFYQQQGGGDYHHRRSYADQAIYYDKYKLIVPSGPSRMQQFRVTIVK